VQDATPADIGIEVRDAAMPIVEAMRIAGWHVGVFHWEKEAERTVNFSARSLSGKSIFVVCSEESLVSKLQSLLDSN